MTATANDEPQADLDPVATLRGRYILEVGQATRTVLAEASVDDVEGLARIAADFADREVQTWRDRPTAPKDLACRAGCSSCCHVPIPTTVPEVIRIAFALEDQRGPDQMARLREKVEGYHRARRGLSGTDRSRIQHPCPLLDEAGQCSIYGSRPLACRGYSSRDLSRCESYHAEPWAGVTIPIDGIQHTIAQGIGLGIQSGLKSLGLGYRMVDLVEAIRIVLDDPEAIDRWLAGEPAFEDAELGPVDPEIHQVEMALLGQAPGRPGG